jgi:hypothetical protein
LAESKATERDFVLQRPSGTFRVQALGDIGAGPVAVVLPFDSLLEHRASAAVRLWRAVTGRDPGPDHAALSPARRDRLVLALRALDARLDDATYREIAATLFGAGAIPDNAWKTHDLRDRTIRLVRYGFSMMRGGYRHLLLHPFRRKS